MFFRKSAIFAAMGLTLWSLSADSSLAQVPGRGRAGVGGGSPVINAASIGAGGGRPAGPGIVNTPARPAYEDAIPFYILGASSSAMGFQAGTPPRPHVHTSDGTPTVIHYEFSYLLTADDVKQLGGGNEQAGLALAKSTAKLLAENGLRNKCDAAPLLGNPQKCLQIRTFVDVQKAGRRPNCSGDKLVEYVPMTLRSAEHVRVNQLLRLGRPFEWSVGYGGSSTYTIPPARTDEQLRSEAKDIAVALADSIAPVATSRTDHSLFSVLNYPGLGWRCSTLYETGGIYVGGQGDNGTRPGSGLGPNVQVNILNVTGDGLRGLGVPR